MEIKVESQDKKNSEVHMMRSKTHLSKIVMRKIKILVTRVMSVIKKWVEVGIGLSLVRTVCNVIVVVSLDIL